MAEIKYNICIKDLHGVWRPVSGEYETENSVLNTAYAIKAAYAITLGVLSPPIMVQRWERQIYSDRWKTVQWRLLESGISTWSTSQPH